MSIRKRDSEEPALQNIQTLLTAIQVLLTTNQAILTSMQGALNSVGTDKWDARTEMLLQTAFQYNPITRDANGRIILIVLFDGVRTKTITIPRDANGRILTIGQVVV